MDVAHTFDTLRLRAEDLLRRQPEHQPDEQSADILELIHELKIHQAELEIQNEDLKQAHAELSDLTQDYLELYEFAPCGYVTLNDRGAVTRANLKATAQLRTERVFLLGAAFSRFIVPECAADYRAALRKAKETGEAQSVELALKQKDGETLWALADISAHLEETDEALQLRIILKDITVQKKMENELNFLGQLLKNVRESVVATDLDGKMIYWNRGAEELYGYAAAEIMDRPVTLIVEAGEEEQEERKRIKTALETGSWRGQYIQKRKDGSRFWSDTLISLVKDGNGRPAGFVGIDRDITEQKENAEKLRQYSDRMEEMVAERTRELEAAQAELLVKERLAVLGHFAGSLSHELRNPLAAIDSSAYYLGMNPDALDEKTREHLGRIRNNIKKSADIIESLLRLSRMEEPKTEKLNLANIVSMILRSSTIPETVDVRLQFPDADIFVDIDSEQIRMALKNIIKNAVQAMDGAGELTVAIQPRGAGLAACRQRRTGKSAPQGEQGSVSRMDAAGAVELTISDTGPGIPPENIEKIFEPLFSTKTHGIGFGLSIVKMVVENHGGAIRAASGPGQGATFVVTLPAASGEPHDG